MKSKMTYGYYRSVFRIRFKELCISKWMECPYNPKVIKRYIPKWIYCEKWLMRIIGDPEEVEGGYSYRCEMKKVYIYILGIEIKIRVL